MSVNASRSLQEKLSRFSYCTEFQVRCSLVVVDFLLVHAHSVCWKLIRSSLTESPSSSAQY